MAAKRVGGYRRTAHLGNQSVDRFYCGDGACFIVGRDGRVVRLEGQNTERMVGTRCTSGTNRHFIIFSVAPS